MDALTDRPAFCMAWFAFLMESSASLETLFDIKSQHMGIVSVSSNPSNNWIVTNTVDGYICIRDSETGMSVVFM